MVPALWPGDRILIWRPPGIVWRPQRGDIVLVRWSKGMPAMIKRVVGMPGERVVVESGQVLINDAPLLEPYLAVQITPQPLFGEWHLGRDEYFVLGDNRIRSADSRRFGPVGSHQIVGRAWYRYVPQSRPGWLIYA